MQYYEYNSGLYKVNLLIDKYKQTHDATIEVYINNVLVAENKKVGHLYKTRDWIKSNKDEAKKMLVKITYQGETFGMPKLNQDEIAMLWNAYKS